MLIYSSSVRDLWHHSEFVEIKVHQCKTLVFCIKTGENILEIELVLTKAIVLA